MKHQSKRIITHDLDLQPKSLHRLSQTGHAILSSDLYKPTPVQVENPFQGMNIPQNFQDQSTTEKFLKAHANHIYNIEDAQLPSNFQDNFSHLPNQIDFKRIMYNVMHALSMLHKDCEWFNTNNNQQNDGVKKSRYDKWLGFLSMKENMAVSSDCFWYIIAKFFKENTTNIQESLLDRISKNYVNYYISIDEGIEKNEFFKYYFDILAQTVFYSIFYAFPKSRHKFKDDLKKDLIAEFSNLFTGIQITNYHRYINNWYLDLGAGNIFKMNIEKQEKPETNQQQQHQEKENQKSNQQKIQNQKQQMKYSPIMQRYLEKYKYKTINFQKGFKMRFTQYDQNQILQKDKFTNYIKKAKFIQEKMKLMQKHSQAKKQEIELEIRQIKQEAVQHQRRLEKRKQEELERGAHEYANYLVSMLNSGITVATLGIGNQNT